MLAKSERGVVLTNLDKREGSTLLDLLGFDPGPGLAELSQLRELSDEFDLRCHPGQGCEVFCRFAAGSKGPTGALDIGGVSVPKPGEEECGDAWEAQESPTGTHVMLVDGLGHGPGASAAARVAVEHFRQSAFADPGAWIRSLHGALRRTQGVVAGVACLDLRAGTITFSGVGNIAASIFDRGKRVCCTSSPGVVGFRLGQVRQEFHPWSASAMLVMHTDGVRQVTDSDKFVGCRAPLAAGAFYRYFGGDLDDCGVVVVRNREIAD